jgi:hypothetical protein
MASHDQMEQGSPHTPSKMILYFFNSIMLDGNDGYVYVLCKKEDEYFLFDAIEDHIIPPFAVVVAAGSGEPDEQTRHHMERYYGFDHNRFTPTTVCNLHDDAIKSPEYC